MAKGLKLRGNYAVSVISYDQLPGMGNIAADFKAAEIETLAWKKNPGFSLRIVWRLARYLRKNNFSVLHTHDLGPLIYGVLARLLGSRARVVHTQHSFVHFADRWKYRFYEKIFARSRKYSLRGGTGKYFRVREIENRSGKNPVNIKWRRFRRPSALAEKARKALRAMLLNEFPNLSRNLEINGYCVWRVFIQARAKTTS